MRNNKQKTPRVKIRLILGAIIVAVFITACPNPDQLMDARVNDFLGDLRRLDGTTDDDQRVENFLDEHFHPEAIDIGAFQDRQTWYDSFAADEITSYSWTTSDRNNSGSFEGTVRLSGSLSGRESDGGTRPFSGVRFFMKQSGSDWLIRAIDDGGDGNLLQNIR